MITLRKLTQSDLQNRVDLLNNPVINSFLNVSEHFTIKKTFDWYNKVKHDNSRFDCVFIYNENVVGMGGLTDISYKNQNAELYMYINPVFQGKGLGYKSTFELCKYGFNVLNLEKIFLFTFSDNSRANGLYEKVGFIKEGVLRKHTIKNGELKDRNIYGLLKNELIQQ